MSEVKISTQKNTSLTHKKNYIKTIEWLTNALTTMPDSNVIKTLVHQKLHSYEKQKRVVFYAQAIFIKPAG